MTFRDIIEEIYKRDSAVTSGAVVGLDGLTVEEWHAPGDSQDMSALGAEAVQFFRESGRIASENGLGKGREAFFAGDQGCVFIHRVAEGYFMVVVASSGTIPGRCRFLLRQAVLCARNIL